MPKGIFRRGNYYYIDYYAHGKRVRERVGDNKTVAKAALNKRKTQIIEGKFLEIRKTEKIKLLDFFKSKEVETPSDDAQQ